MNVSPLSPEMLEQRAVQQRNRIHQTTLELISKVDEAKKHLTPSYQLRRHFLGMSLIACSIALLAGYYCGSLFKRR